MKQDHSDTVIVEGERVRVDWETTVAELKERCGIPRDAEVFWWSGGPGFRPLQDEWVVLEYVVPGAPIVFKGVTDPEVVELLLEHGNGEGEERLEALPAETLPEKHC